MSAAQLENLAKDWRPFSKLVCVPRTEDDYNRLVTLLTWQAKGYYFWHE